MTVPYDRELIAQMLDVCGHPMYTLDAYREQARLLREADNADAAKVGTAIANAQQPAAVDGAMVERIAALLHEEAADEPWAVAGVEHDGPDRDYYRTLARKVIALAGQQGGEP